MVKQTSYAMQNDLHTVVVETLVDAYAHLRRLKPQVIRHKDFEKDLDFLGKRYSELGENAFTAWLPILGDHFMMTILGTDLTSPELHYFVPLSSEYRFLRPFWKYGWEVLRPLSLSPEPAGAFSEDQANLVRCLRTLFFGLKRLKTAYKPPEGE